MNFKLDNPVFDFITTFCNYILLNLVFLFTCLPVFTIGTSFTALYRVMIKETNKEHGYLIRTYLKEWKNCFFQTLGAFILFFGVLSLLIFNFVFWSNFDSIFSMIITTVMGVVIILCVLTADYAFYLFAAYEDSFKETIKNGFYLGLSDPRYAISLLAINAIIVSLLIYVPAVKVLMLTFGFVYLFFVKTMLFQKRLKKTTEPK